MNVPAQQIDAIKKAIEAGSATAEDIATYTQWHMDIARHEGEQKALEELMASDLQARAEAARQEAAVSQLKLTELAFKALERLENGNAQQG